MQLEKIYALVFPILSIPNNIPSLGDLRKHVIITTLTLTGIQSRSTIVLQNRRTSNVMVEGQLSYPLLPDNHLSQL